MRKFFQRLFGGPAAQRQRQSEEYFDRLVAEVNEYAIFQLDPQGNVASWNAGAERLKGYRAEEIVGRHFACFYPPEAISKDWPAHELKAAATTGPFENDNWRSRQDRSRVWANVYITTSHSATTPMARYLQPTFDLTPPLP